MGSCSLRQIFAQQSAVYCAPPWQRMFASPTSRFAQHSCHRYRHSACCRHVCTAAKRTKSDYKIIRHRADQLVSEHGCKSGRYRQAAQAAHAKSRHRKSDIRIAHASAGNNSKQNSGLTDVIGSLNQNPLPDGFVISPKQNEAASTGTRCVTNWQSCQGRTGAT